MIFSTISEVLDKYLVIKENRYFKHMNMLHPSLKKHVSEKSGICRHMIFDKSILTQMFNLIRDYHKNHFGKFSWSVLIRPNIREWENTNCILIIC